MAFIPAPLGTIKLEVIQSLRGQQCVNVLHYFTEQNVGVSELEELCSEFSTAWSAGANGIQDYQNQDIVTEEIRATKVDTQGGLQAALSLGTPGSGGAASASLSNMQAVCVSFRTATSGRSGRGRMYVGGIDKTFLEPTDSNYITAATGLGMKIGGDALHVFETVIETYNLVITSYFTNNAPRVLAVNYPVTQTLVDRRIDTQRRRRPPA